MDNKLLNTSKAYSEIFEVLKKHENSIKIDVSRLKERADLHLWGLELKEIYGLEIDTEDITSKDWCRIDDFIYISYYAANVRGISWEDNGQQPVDEHLLVFTFSAGGYTLGDKFHPELFREFFDELKTYNPKYCDTNNSSLYFSLDNAKDVYNNFSVIYERYRQRYCESVKQSEIKELELKLKELKGKQ
jgi:hypothetical protein